MIFVTGCARSGTSLTTQILKDLGCNLGHVNVLFENMEIRENILKPYLRSVKADPLGQWPLPDTNNLPSIPNLYIRVMGCFPEWEPRAYKDAKLTLVWPVFAKAFPDAKWVIVRRDKERIVDSCLDTTFMFRHKERESWRGWVDAHEARFADMRDQRLEMIEVWPDHYVDYPNAFREVAEFCGLKFDPTVVANAVNPKAWTKAKVS